MPFNAPIPGQSLTTTPRNAPYERPPQVVDPEGALALHLDRLADEDRMDGVMQFLERGLDVQTMTEGLLRSAVANGVHTVDVSLIIGPAIHEYIKRTADKLGVEYKEGPDFDKEDEDVVQSKAGRSMAAGRFLRDKPKTMQKSDDVIELGPETPAESSRPIPSKGLMSRR